MPRRIQLPTASILYDRMAPMTLLLSIQTWLFWTVCSCINCDNTVMSASSADMICGRPSQTLKVMKLAVGWSSWAGRRVRDQPPASKHARQIYGNLLRFLTSGDLYLSDCPGERSTHQLPLTKLGQKMIVDIQVKYHSSRQLTKATATHYSSSSKCE